MSKKKDYYTLCEQFVDQHKGNRDQLVDLLDHMLARVAIEAIEDNMNVQTPIERLFEHLKEQIAIDISIKQHNLTKLEKVDLIKILRGDQ